MITNPLLEIWLDGAKQADIALQPPANLPHTEFNGAPYSTNTWSCVVPSQWRRPGLNVRATSVSYEPSAMAVIDVGMASNLNLFTLPFYLFGCTPSTCGPLVRLVNQHYYRIHIKSKYQKTPLVNC
eukprot:gene3520-4023_t